MAQPAAADSVHELAGGIRALEARMDYLATKEDIGEVKALIADLETRMLRWLVGILGVLAVGMTASVIATTLGVAA